MVCISFNLCESTALFITTKTMCISIWPYFPSPFYKGLSVPFLGRQFQFSGYHVSLFTKEIGKYRKVILTQGNHKSAFAPPSFLCNFPSFLICNPTSLVQLLTHFSAPASSFLTLSPLASRTNFHPFNAFTHSAAFIKYLLFIRAQGQGMDLRKFHTEDIWTGLWRRIGVCWGGARDE